MDSSKYFSKPLYLVRLINKREVFYAIASEGKGIKNSWNVDGLRNRGREKIEDVGSKSIFEDIR